MSVKDLWDLMILDEYGYLKPVPRQHLPFYSWPGSYTILYLTAGGADLCADCATKALYLLDEEFDQPTAYSTYDEGPVINCDDCGRAIESSYGEPEDNS